MSCIHIPRPHTDILLYINSATRMSMARTKMYAFRGFTDLTRQEYDRPEIMLIERGVYHPSGLFPHKTHKLEFILPCVFSSTGYVKKCVTLPELCSIWDISPALCKLFSKLQFLEFWSILINPIKLLQCGLLHSLLIILGWGRVG